LNYQNKMLHTQKMRHLSQAVAAIVAIAFGLPIAVQPTWAQSPDQKTIQDTQIIFNDPAPPQQGSPSGRQRGGASRGPCRQFGSLTALVPATKGVVWGQTVSDRPSFWFHLPGALTEKTPIEFVVQDVQDNYVYKTRITAPGTPAGLIEVAMPAMAKPLEVGQPYFWTFSVYCNPNKPSEAVFVKGMIQRVASDATLQNRLKSIAPLDQVRWYADQGIWHDAVDTLAELYRAKPSDRQLASTWNTLLKQTNLEKLTTAPFSPCCTAKP
jgi:hypothetical protein